MNDATRTDHAERILRVLTHMQAHIDDDLSPGELAEIACYSPHHFHRTFSGMVGESVMAHLRRIRLERAAWRLKFGDRQVMEVALEAGYDSHEAFTRAFGAVFSMPPSEFRDAHRKIEFPRAPSGVHFSPDSAVSGFAPQQPRRNDPMQITSFAERRVAFVRHLGPYQGVGVAWERLCLWAAEQGLIGPGATMLGLSYDDPEITPPERIRYDACIVVGDDVEAEGDIGVQVIAGGEYAVMRHRGPYENLGSTYAELFGRALPAAGREAAVLPTVEIYWNDPEGTQPEDLETDVCVLLKPA